MREGRNKWGERKREFALISTIINFFPHKKYLKTQISSY